MADRRELAVDTGGEAVEAGQVVVADGVEPGIMPRVVHDELVGFVLGDLEENADAFITPGQNPAPLPHLSEQLPKPE
ncbi:hypothetical protein [Streptomyces sp. NBC_01013]|uniref:hypothetical protein n=1 Tax=Streptomyces sp. NBC_01013 TaxID=2903718 RepID=UPI00386C30FB|nr:hypothetical protein OG538_36335 [Streptomyces sp. NBC_01013]